MSNVNELCSNCRRPLDRFFEPRSVDPAAEPLDMTPGISGRFFSTAAGAISETAIFAQKIVVIDTASRP